MKSPNNSNINQWIVIYFFGAFIFFIFTLFLIFFQKNENRFVYLNNHANDLEYNKDYQNALKIWKKLYENSPHESSYLLKILQNYLLQENYSAIIQTVNNYNKNVYDQDTFLLLLKHCLFSSKKLNNDSLIQKYTQQINNILNIDVYWDTKSHKWIYIDEMFTISKLKKWVDVMYSLLNQEVSIYTILKDTETPFYYYYSTISFNKKLLLENDVYENLTFNQSSRINPNEISQYKNLNLLGLLWFTLKKNNFSNVIWLDKLKTEWSKKKPEEILNFLKNSKVLVPISYQNQNYYLNQDYEKLPKIIYKIIYEKLKDIKNNSELEKLSGIFLYLQSKLP